MAETVYLLDGTMEVVLTEKDVFIERLIREKLGDDAARFVTEYIRELVEEAKYSEEAQQEAESISDDYLTLCNDALDTFRQLKALVREPRLDKGRLQTVIDAGYDNLYKNL